MKILIFLGGFGSSFAFGTFSSAQTKINIDVNNVTLEEVFKDIEKKSEYIFLYKNSIFDKNVKVSLHLVDASVNKILDTAFNNTNLKYSIDERQIVVYESEKKANSSIIQQLKVSGEVKDENGYPLPGATVLVKGTSIGVITDFDGRFSINARIGNVLEVSYQGYVVNSVKVTGKDLNITMHLDMKDLEEVVVIGYGTVKKKELTGAVSQVKSEDIENIVTSDLGNALQGQVAGLNIVNSSQPGGGSTILIRGITSISGDNTPLFVVDGIPQEGDPGIPPAEIQSIDVLKDAASAAIYGTRGAAGVILITTKRGEPGTLKVQVNGSYGIQNITSDIPLMNSEEQTYFDLVKDRNTTGSTDDVSVLNLIRNPEGFQNNTQLSKLVFVNNAPIQNYTANISGGNENITYNVSTGLFEQAGSIINSNFKRFSTRANTSYKNGKWKVNMTVGLNKEERTRASGSLVTKSITYYPTQEGLDFDSDEPIQSFSGEISTRLGWVLNSFNNTDLTNRTKAYSYFDIGYELIKGLNLNTRVGIRETNDFRERFNGYTPVYNAESGELLSNPSSSYVENIASRYSSTTWDFSLNYKKEIYKNHNLTLTGAVSREQYIYRNFTAQKYGVVSNDIRVLNNATLSPDARSGNNYNNTLVGLIGRFQYDYKGKYLFSSSVRRDGSSKFGEDHRWGTFPSVSVGWNISDESFWSPLKSIINNSKLRLSRGTAGNQSFSPYSFSAGISQGIDYAFGASGSDVLKFGSTQVDYANAVVKWETSVQNNIGIDLGFFKNKLTLSAEYYDTQKENMLFPIVLPGSAGGGSDAQVILNVGDMTNKGYELEMGYRGNIRSLNFRMNGTFVTNENKITKINGDGGFLFTNDYGLIEGDRAGSQVTVLAEGYEAGAFFLYRTNGIVDTAEKLADYQEIVPNASMGDLIYIDQDDNGFISDDDRVYSGSGLPEYEIGYNLFLDYKNFDFSMQWYSALGHELMNGAKATAYGAGRHKDLLYAYSDVNTETTIPSYRDSKSDPNYKGYTDLWLEKGDYLRLKNITIGYSLPEKITNRMRISKFRIYATAQNILTITNYEGYDPEVGGDVSSRGLDKEIYPISSLYTLGLNFNF